MTEKAPKQYVIEIVIVLLLDISNFKYLHSSGKPISLMHYGKRTVIAYAYTREKDCIQQH